MSEPEMSGLLPSDDPPHVLAVCGSRREGSYTRRALSEVIRGVEGAGGTGAVLDLGDVNLLPFDPSDDAAGDADAVTQWFRTADAVILGTPMYHGSYSGVLKNAIDYCGFDEFEGTTVGLLAVSGGPFPLPALDHLRPVCRALNAWVLPHQAAIPQAHFAFDDDGFTDDDVRQRVRTLGERAVLYASIEPARRRVVAEPEV